MCVINNCDKTNCLHSKMAVREKIALLLSIVVAFHAINCVVSLPKNMARRARPGAKHVFSTTPAPRTKQKMARNGISRPNQEDVCQIFNFPETQYPSAATPSTPLYFHNFENKLRDTHTLKITQPNKRLDAHKNRKMKAKHPAQGTKDAEFTSAPSYRDIGTFPDVEYPLSNKDVWRPNFWNCPPKTHSTNVTSKSTRRKHAMNTKSIFKAINKVAPTSQSDMKYNRNQPALKEVELPTKKRSHDQFTPVEPFFENTYTATPTPQLQEEISALRTKLATNIAQKAVSMIRDRVNSRTTTEHTMSYNDLEDILCLPRISNSLDTSKRESVSDLNPTESPISVFTAYTERPEIDTFNQSNVTFAADNTSLLPLSDNRDMPLSPRVSHSNDTIIVEAKAIYNGTANDSESDIDYTTDDPSDSFALSTATLIDNWRNTDVIDPYRSVSYPDELEEYYLAVI